MDVREDAEKSNIFTTQNNPFSFGNNKQNPSSLMTTKWLIKNKSHCIITMVLMYKLCADIEGKHIKSSKSCLI